MTSEYIRVILNKSIAQICQNIGWNSAHSTPIDLLNDMVRYFLQNLCKVTHNYSNLYGRTEPNLDDLGLAFQDVGVNINELSAYVNCVEQVPFAHKLPSFPVCHPSKIVHPKPGSKELRQRAEHIHDHLPPMYSEMEEEEPIKIDSAPFNGDAALTPLKRTELFDDGGPPAKRARLCFAEEEGRPMREMTSVFMSPSGFISPNREGRLPNPAVPPLADSPVHSPHHSLAKESKKDKSKSKKNKNGNKESKKEGKKIKSKKENKENSHSKTDFPIIPTKEASTPKSKKSKSLIKSPSKSNKIKKENKKKSRSNTKSEKSKNKYMLGNSTLSSPKDFTKVKSPEKNEHLIPTVAPKETNNKVEVKLDKAHVVTENVYNIYNNSNISSEPSPESRLVIDDSLETQQRQEKESRMAVLDECIDAVILKGVEDTVKDDLSFKDDDDDYDDDELEKELLFSSHKKLEPKDVYDFTDTSNDSFSPTPAESPVNPPVDNIFNDSPSPHKKSKEQKKKKKKSKGSLITSPKPMSPKLKLTEKLSSSNVYTDSENSSSSSPSHPFSNFSPPVSARTLSHSSFPTPPLFGRTETPPSSSLDYRPELQIKEEKKEKKNKVDKKEKAKKKNKDKTRDKESSSKKESTLLKKDSFIKKEKDGKKESLPKKEDIIRKEHDNEKFKPEKIKSEKKNKIKPEKEKKKTTKEPDSKAMVRYFFLMRK